jgi:hypothetical protein
MIASHFSERYLSTQQVLVTGSHRQKRREASGRRLGERQTMTMPTHPLDDVGEHREYHYIEYESNDDTVSVIQDCQNESAWLQSTVSVPVEP